MRLRIGFLLLGLQVMSNVGCGNKSESEGSGSSGGDPVRGAFLDGKADATLAVLESKESDRLQLASQVVSNWVEAHRQELAEDIRLSPHVWAEVAASTCARTERKPKAEIQLSIPSCREAIKDKAAAAFLLIHESVHHLGVEDESFADQVAYSVTGKKATRPQNNEDPGRQKPLMVELNDIVSDRFTPNEEGSAVGWCSYPAQSYHMATLCRPVVSVRLLEGFNHPVDFDQYKIQKDDLGYRILINEYVTGGYEKTHCPKIDIRLEIHITSC